MVAIYRKVLFMGQQQSVALPEEQEKILFTEKDGSIRRDHRGRYYFHHKLEECLGQHWAKKGENSIFQDSPILQVRKGNQHENKDSDIYFVRKTV